MNKYTKLHSRYNQLEKDVYVALKKEISRSKFISEHTNTKAINVNVFEYIELTFINGDLVFLDKHGYQYSLYADCSLEDLVHIINTI